MRQNGIMARGWESKSVEAQQAEAAEAVSPEKPRLTREDAARLREKETLRLARQRVLEQLKAHPSDRHAEMLAAALREIESRLGALEPPAHSAVRPPD
jgi:hypothetical protein